MSNLLVEFNDRKWKINIPKNVSFRSFTGSVAPKNIQLKSRTKKAVRQPESFPPLHQCVVPGDQVILAVDRCIPFSKQWLEPILEELLSAQIACADIQILVSNSEIKSQVQQLIQEIEPKFQAIQIETIEWDDNPQFGFLGALDNHRTLHLKREILDADCVIAVDSTRYDPLIGVRCGAGTIFPQYFNQDNHLLVQKYAMELDRPPWDLHSRQKVDEIGNLLGMLLNIHFDLDRYGKMINVRFDTIQSNRKQNREAIEQQWTVETDEHLYDLVIASMDPGTDKCCWEDLISGLENALLLAKNDASIVLLTNLDDSQSPGFQELLKHEDLWDALESIRQTPNEEPFITSKLARYLSSNKVYLASGLEDELVENAFMIPIGHEKELQNLINRSKSLFLLNDANRAMIDTRLQNDNE